VGLRPLLEENKGLLKDGGAPEDDDNSHSMTIQHIKRPPRSSNSSSKPSQAFTALQLKQHHETPFDLSIRKAAPRIAPAVANTLESFEGVQNAVVKLDPASFGFLNRKWLEICEVRRVFACSKLLHRSLLCLRDTINLYSTPSMKLGGQEF